MKVSVVVIHHRRSGIEVQVFGQPADAAVAYNEACALTADDEDGWVELHEEELR